MDRTAKKPHNVLQQVVRHLEPHPPFRLDFTAWALRRQPNNRIDTWDGENYTRIFVFNRNPVRAEVSQEGESGKPRLTVLLSGPVLPQETVDGVLFLLEGMLGTQMDLGDFYRMAGQDNRLREMAREFIGVRPPRFPTMFEALINAFACQQISLNVCITLLVRLAQTYGTRFPDSDVALFSFPGPEQLARADSDALRNLGFSRNKAAAIIGLSKAVLDGTFDPDAVATMPDSDAVDRLREIPGIGQWSAEYALLRGLGRLNVFPGDDVGAQNNVQRFLSLRSKPDSAGIRRIMKRWNPYQGFVYFHFLLRKLKEKGLLA